MFKHSPLKQDLILSPIKAQATVRPRQGRSKKHLTTSLVLTSLVDAFSILVIYLLVNTSATNESLEITKGMELPLASQSESLEAGLVVKIENNKYIIEEQEVSLDDMNHTLSQIHDELIAQSDRRVGHLIIQADKSTPYDLLNPLVTAGSVSGFKKIKFAVLHEETL